MYEFKENSIIEVYKNLIIHRNKIKWFSIVF